MPSTRASIVIEKRIAIINLIRDRILLPKERKLKKLTINGSEPETSFNQIFEFLDFIKCPKAITERKEIVLFYLITRTYEKLSIISNSRAVTINQVFIFDIKEEQFCQVSFGLEPAPARAAGAAAARRHLTTGGTAGYVLAEARGQRFTLRHNCDMSFT
ncbi:hypothetical protein EVAR_97929_1 [Eumeta japonica]|uniref:Uncharacterized protein n=1 Tax=Eumeta variegata TaxID=151549 RepID=A0A4C1XTU5_EUMVA|nr:hypothetical protein EVAR_97929_1 [Eumeta japonica]